MYQTEYERWLTASLEDPALTEELRGIEGNGNEIKERFAVSLKFGTAGLRGILGVGTNRMITRGEAKPVTCAADILSEFTDDAGDDVLNGAAKKVTFTSLGAIGQEIYMALLQGEKDADELLEWIDCSAQDLNAALTRLLFAEVIKQLPGRIYALDTIHTVVTFDQ